MHRSATDPFLHENPSRSTHFDSQIQANHFPKQTDVLRFIEEKRRSSNSSSFSLDALIVSHRKQLIYTLDFVPNVVYLGKN
jgi:hypothetical protein